MPCVIRVFKVGSITLQTSLKEHATRMCPGENWPILLSVIQQWSEAEQRQTQQGSEQALKRAARRVFRPAAQLHCWGPSQPNPPLPVLLLGPETVTEPGCSSEPAGHCSCVVSRADRSREMKETQILFLKSSILGEKNKKINLKKTTVSSCLYKTALLMPLSPPGCHPSSADRAERRERAGALLPLGGDLRPPGVPVPVHRLGRPLQPALLLHLARGQQLPGVLPDLCRVVRPSSSV